MKRIILSVFIAFFSMTLNASIHNYQTDKMKERIEKMDKVVGFTEDQKVKYKALLEKNDKEKLEFQAKVKDKPLDERKKMQTEFRNSFEKELKAILTTDQWKKIEAEKAKNQGQN